ncbi:hypothetical protein [uncultured Methylobacterium sp.]|jgi:hypothetical protein|uniref:hypothetical protein n=1 Tax=uncultured Methylobacterium sp. TaxID=157278 RepID=UPI002603D58C|nr:hypothetical protein [uncultured Methylobacterium sp.]
MGIVLAWMLLIPNPVTAQGGLILDELARREREAVRALDRGADDRAAARRRDEDRERDRREESRRDARREIERREEERARDRRP